MDINLKIKEMQVRLEKEVGEAINEIGDVVSEISQDYAELAPEIERNPNLITDVVSQLVIEKAKLPKFIPDFVVKFVIKAILSKFIKK